MSWRTVDEVAHIRRCTTRQIYRLIERGKLQAQSTAEGTQIWIEETGGLVVARSNSEIQTECVIPGIPASKLGPEVLKKVEGMLISIAATADALKVEQQVQDQYGIPSGTQRRWKAEVRKLFNLPPRARISSLQSDPRVRQAIEYIIVRKEPSDKGSLRSAQGLVVLMNVATGEAASAEEYLIKLYSREGMNAFRTYVALRNQCVQGKVFHEGKSLERATVDKLPSLASVTRWLRLKKKNNLPLLKSKMTRQEWDAFNVYVKRNPAEHRVRGFQEGDHTELDVQVINSETGKYDRLWVTAWVDRHTDLGCGYFLSYRPNSETIALAARNSFTGAQLKVAAPDASKEGGVLYRPLKDFNDKLNPSDIPDDVCIDNGKDYRSRYTGQIFGKIDFSDEARHTIQRFSRVHYAQKLHPQSKPFVESCFRLLNEFWKNLPGYKGPHYKLKPDTLRGEEKQNVLLFDWQFAQIFDLAWSALNNRPMRRLKDLSRIEYYLQNRSTSRVISDERIFDLLMMKVEARKIRRGYVSVNGVEYFSMELQRFNGDSCAIYLDPQNIGYAHVWIGERFVTTAIKSDLIGTTQREWIEIVKMRKDKDRSINEEIRQMHVSLSDLEAKSHAWNGMIGNVSFVSGESLSRECTSVNLLTGVEGQAIELAERKSKQEQVGEIERKAKRRSVMSLLTRENVLNNVK